MGRVSGSRLAAAPVNDSPQSARRNPASQRTIRAGARPPGAVGRSGADVRLEGSGIRLLRPANIAVTTELSPRTRCDRLSPSETLTASIQGEGASESTRG